MIRNYDDDDFREVQDIVRIGRVSSVNKEQMTARVLIDEEGIVSGDLRIIQRTPLITVVNKDAGVKWEYEAEYVSYDRQLGMNETYKKDYPERIYTQSSSRSQTIKIYPWLPYIGQWVLCIFKPDGEGDGFIIGGI